VIGSRHWLEKDSDYLQLIPSIVFRKPDGSILYYQRVKGTGESRLLGNYSVTAGGHLALQDLCLKHDNCNYKTSEIEVIDSCWNGIYREVQEELGVDLDSITDTDFDTMFSEFKGFIYDTSNDVGSKHIGLLFVFDVAEDVEFDAGIAESEGMLLKGFDTPHRLSQHHDYDAINLENWSRIVCDYLDENKV
jgi:predicted NUDIX family phosphoesterase